MKTHNRTRRTLVETVGVGMLLIAVLAVFASFSTKLAAFAPPWRPMQKHRADSCNNCSPSTSDVASSDVGGTWYWMRSPDEEKRVVMGLFNKYCIRCHDIDGRGKWDIPGVPDLTNSRWQASRTDEQLARRILEGRGAVMPAFRGTLSLEEAWAMARYLRTFDPNNQISQPDFTQQKKIEKPGK